jgi:hypothetical protein
MRYLTSLNIGADNAIGAAWVKIASGLTSTRVPSGLCVYASITSRTCNESLYGIGICDHPFAPPFGAQS